MYHDPLPWDIGSGGRAWAKGADNVWQRVKDSDGLGDIADGGSHGGLYDRAILAGQLSAAANPTDEQHPFKPEGPAVQPRLQAIELPGRSEGHRGQESLYLENTSQ